MFNETYLRKQKGIELMEEVKVFENPDFGEVRTLEINGEPWFVGKDVAILLGYAKPTDTIRKRVDDEDKGISKIETPSGIQDMIIINESGLYSLIFGSKLESAKEFKHWVTSEVLPEIRKTGSYVSKGEQGSYMIEDPIERAKRWIEEQEERKTLECKVAEMSPKAELCDKLLDAKLLVNFRDAAKEIGISQTQFTGWLRDNGYVYSNSAGELRPMEAYMESGLFQMKPYQNPYNGYKGSRTYITGRGLAAFKMLIDDSGHNRDTMKKHGGKKKRQ